MEFLERAHMTNCNSTQTLVDSEFKLESDEDPVPDPTLYCSLAGGLQYLTFTLQDISYDVNQIFHYMHDPREPHLASFKHILHYVQVAETIWLRNLLHELHSPLQYATIVYYDNVRVLHVPSRYQYVNSFTKGFPSVLFEELHINLSVQSPPTPTAREC
nr:ribonuclease H-like domain-containing protein [Tanacetum cinerariifolium]